MKEHNYLDAEWVFIDVNFHAITFLVVRATLLLDVCDFRLYYHELS